MLRHPNMSTTSTVAVAAMSTILVTVSLMSKMPTERSAHAQSPASIEQPAEWVPLTATYEISVPSRAPFLVIRYVSADGSRRTETSNGPAGLRVDIDNVSANKHYELRDNVWTEHPLREQTYGGKPFERLNPSMAKLVAIDDSRVQAITALGFAAYEAQSPADNSTTVSCPKLNMLTVFEKNRYFTEELRSVILGEPSIDFTPPAGVAVAHSNVPGGRGRATPEEIQRIRDGMNKIRR